jgi:hypothetical protein
VAAAEIKYREATELPQAGAKRERDSAKHKIVVGSAQAFRPNDFAVLTTILCFALSRSRFAPVCAD